MSRYSILRLNIKKNIKLNTLLVFIEIGWNTGLKWTLPVIRLRKKIKRTNINVLLYFLYFRKYIII